MNRIHEDDECRRMADAIQQAAEKALSNTAHDGYMTDDERERVERACEAVRQAGAWALRGVDVKPLLYDVCCKAGGATRGYQRAGFRVIGIDKDPQPRYVGDGFIQMDAIEFMRRYLAGEYEQAQAFAGSPPCQFATDATLVWRSQGKTYPNLIPALRDAFLATGLPYAIENVPGAAKWLRNPVVLNGGMFGMNVHRVRLFECNFPVPFPLLPPMPQPVKMGRPVKAGEIIQPVGHFSNVAYAREQMGLDWMTQEEIAEAIPPAFTEWVGRYMMLALRG